MRLVLVICSFLMVNMLQAQLFTNVTISNDTIPIGQEVELTFSIQLSGKSNIKSVDFKAFESISSEIKTSDMPDSIMRDDIFAEIEWPAELDTKNKILQKSDFVQTGSKLEKTMKIRFWDIGLFTLPALKVNLDSVSTHHKVRTLESPTVLVYPPQGIAPADTTQMMMPITDILKESKKAEDYYWIGYLLLTLLITGLIFYYYYLKEKKRNAIPEEVVVIKRPAHEIALDSLDDLNKKELWQTGQVKEYQSELTHIIRAYLEDRYEINALESTTGEIFEDLQKTDFDENQNKNLQEVLMMADLVKFAKASPSDDIHSSFMDRAYELVRETKKIIVETEVEDGLDT